MLCHVYMVFTEVTFRMGLNHLVSQIAIIVETARDVVHNDGSFHLFGQVEIKFSRYDDGHDQLKCEVQWRGKTYTAGHPELDINCK